MPQTEYEQMGINAALGAKDFDFPQLTKKLVDVIDYVESKCK